jgi:hypothetical protein
MITHVRTANIHDGKLADALAWAAKVCKYLRDHHGTNTQLARNIGGQIFQLHWVSTYPTLADFEKTMKKVENDAGYMALIGEARQQVLFIGTSVTDALHEMIA